MTSSLFQFTQFIISYGDFSLSFFVNIFYFAFCFVVDVICVALEQTVGFHMVLILFLLFFLVSKPRLLLYNTCIYLNNVFTCPIAHTIIFYTLYDVFNIVSV